MPFVTREHLEMIEDALLKARSSIAELLEEHNWRPIETAPRDGTHILLFWPSFKELRKLHTDGAPMIAEGWWCAPEIWTKEHFARNGEVTLDEATHWMPLPEAPK